VEKHETVAQSYLVWGTLALHYADVYHALFKQRDLHQFLLTVVKSIFQVLPIPQSVLFQSFSTSVGPLMCLKIRLQRWK